MVSTSTSSPSQHCRDSDFHLCISATSALRVRAVEIVGARHILRIVTDDGAHYVDLCVPEEVVGTQVFREQVNGSWLLKSTQLGKLRTHSW